MKEISKFIKYKSYIFELNIKIFYFKKIKKILYRKNILTIMKINFLYNLLIN